ncbi:FAD binding domain-containing protein [Rhodococcus sp. P1Y]|uniref:FAD binding domain-containing protein n=1 Tax=Rhodococcus sp. P1Y TaxID=1302308 RepID=UPI000EB09CEF|nr:FAD binding domain-containing protein [Rhodococcus sp. P1Y]AYJ49220.1 FAD-binding molybdopterin dehydrogenase [Rhodococcus sp. P1Y]
MDLGTIEDIVVARERSELPLGDEHTAVIAGGTWLLSEKQDHLRRLVDITTLGWAPLTESDDGLDIAATCTIEQLSRASFDRDWPATTLFHRCATALLASFKIWKVATVGGNVCLALPAGAMVSLTTALDGVALVWSPDGTDYRIPVTDLVTGPHENALKAGEVVRSIRLPAHALMSRTAFRKNALSPLGRSASVVIGRIDPGNQFVLSVTASTTRPFVLRFPEPPTAEVLESALSDSIPNSAWYDDPHGAPDWREHISRKSAREILEELTC